MSTELETSKPDSLNLNEYIEAMRSTAPLAERLAYARQAKLLRPSSSEIDLAISSIKSQAGIPITQVRPYSLINTLAPQNYISSIYLDPILLTACVFLSLVTVFKKKFFYLLFPVCLILFLFRFALTYDFDGTLRPISEYQEIFKTEAIATSELSLFAAQTKSDQIVAIIKPGIAFDILQEKEGWNFIRTPEGRMGWLPSDSQDFIVLKR